MFMRCFILKFSDDGEYHGARTTTTPFGQRLGLLDGRGHSSVGLN